MLLSLRIENLAVVEAATVDFAPGLVVLSGETGAGKSILLSALNLCLGGRASVEMVRTGAPHAIVEARFLVSPTLNEALASAGLEPCAELVLRRQVNARGPGRAWCNGQPATLALLSTLGAALMDVVGQHDQHGLLDPAEHLRLLDRAAGSESEQERFAAAWAELRAARHEHSRLESAAKNADERADILAAQLNELESLGLRPDEHEGLRAERRLLQHATELSAGCRAAEALLYSGQDAATDRLIAAASALTRLAMIDPSLGSIAESLAELRYQAEDLARTLQDRVSISADPERLDVVESRLEQIERLARKHRCEPEALINRHAALAAELAEIEDLDEAIRRAEQRLMQRGQAALLAATALSERRRDAAAGLESRVGAELAALSMAEARFKVSLLPALDGENIDGQLLGENGLDRAEFLLSANPGEDLRPMARVASGGELSRLLLAIKLSLRGSLGVPTFVADEIDAGLGGQAAAKVGARLATLSRFAQVICITHLPQVAGLASQHLLVEKSVRQGRTRATVSDLDQAGRVAELARMLGGRGEMALTWAEQLLDECRNAA